jgi:hypothetical protein
VVLVGVLAKMGGRTTGVGVQAGNRLPPVGLGEGCFIGRQKKLAIGSIGYK